MIEITAMSGSQFIGTMCTCIGEIAPYVAGILLAERLSSYLFSVIAGKRYL